MSDQPKEKPNGGNCSGPKPPPGPIGIDLTPIARLTRDLRVAARILSDDEARFLVDAYYAMQADRIRAAHQMRALGENKEPNSIMEWLLEQRESLESQVGKALDAYSASKQIGQWMRSIHGIGPVISAGMMAHIYMGEWCKTCHGRNPLEHQRRIDNKKLSFTEHDYQPEFSCPTAGHIWRFAGLDPTVKWEKGQKRPFNASLKRLCWIVGESFVKVSGNEDAYYGQIYKERKQLEETNNAAGKFAEQAALSLKTKKFDPKTDAHKHYTAGHLPPARIHLRAKRYATKFFLSHLQAVWWEMATGTKPPVPYIMTHALHTHYRPPPNWPMKTK